MPATGNGMFHIVQFERKPAAGYVPLQCYLFRTVLPACDVKPVTGLGPGKDPVRSTPGGGWVIEWQPRGCFEDGKLPAPAPAANQNRRTGPAPLPTGAP